MTSGRGRGAVFLDRDGTLVVDEGFLSRPEDVALLPGAAEGLAALARAGWPLVLVSNQSGIARGLYGPDAFHLTNARLSELVNPHHVSFLAAYFCPHHPDFGGQCRCRKPGTLLFEQAARDHALDLAASWYIGDRWRDLQPALALGGRGVLVRSPETGDEEREAALNGIPVAGDMREVAAFIIGS